MHLQPEHVILIWNAECIGGTMRKIMCPYEYKSNVHPEKDYSDTSTFHQRKENYPLSHRNPLFKRKSFTTTNRSQLRVYTAKSLYYKHHSQKSIMPSEYIHTARNTTVAEFGLSFKRPGPQFTFKWKNCWYRTPTKYTASTYFLKMCYELIYGCHPFYYSLLKMCLDFTAPSFMWT